METILSIHQMSQAEAARILRALEAVHPPEGMDDLHEAAVRAYRYIVWGKRQLPARDSEGRAEALFMVDWGIALLQGYREGADAMLAGS